MSPLRRAAILLLAASFLAACTQSAPAQPGTSKSAAKSATNPTAAKQQLAKLATAAPLSMAGYSRDRFPHWKSQGGGCDTREAVLKRDGKNVKSDANCKAVSGDWYSPYDDTKHTAAGEMDIDHMVPLAAAWRSGAKNWDDTKRGDFANDLTRPQLLAVSASTNRSKGDQDPSTWTPPNRGYWCVYATSWIAVKSYWQLAVTEAERTKLTEMLGTC